MTTNILDVVAVPLTANYAPLSFSYLNAGRSWNPLTTQNTALGITLSSYSFLRNVKDIEFTETSVSFLTDFVSISSMLGNANKNIRNITYYANTTNDALNQGVNLYEAADVNSNFLVTAPLASSINFNIIPLKNGLGLTHEQGWYDSFRSYNKLFFSSSAGADRMDLFNSYQSSFIPKTIESDLDDTININHNITPIALSAMGLIESGAIAGKSPANSDMILLERNGYATNGREPLNGEPLCIWLSGADISPTSDKKWMERWYDPNTVTQGDALVSSIGSSDYHYIFDIPTEAIIQENDTFTVKRYGPERNKNFIDSLSADLVMHLDTWNNTFTDKMNDIEGFVVGHTQTDSTVLTLDGATHAHVPPVDEMFIEHNFSIASWVYSDNWKASSDSQIFGNFSKGEGYGLFYDSSATSHLLTFPSNQGIIYGFNYRGYKIFEKNLNLSTDLQDSNITLIVTDFFGARWMFDDNNKVLIKLESDDLLRKIVALPSSATIINMKIDQKNRLIVFNSEAQALLTYDSDGTYIGSTAVPALHTNFEIDLNNIVRTSVANLMVCDNENNIFKTLGSNIYKNEQMFFHVGKPIQRIKIDLDNNLWILFDKNRLMKISPDNKIVFNRIIDTYFTETSFEMCFVRESNNEQDKDNLWLIHNTYKNIIKINAEGDIIKRLNLDHIINLRKCNNFVLSVNGEFTEFDIKRKYHRFADGTVVNRNNPAFSIKMNLTCGLYKELHQSFYPVSNLKGWTHLGMSHEIVGANTYISLIINGIRRVRYELGDGGQTRLVDFGTRVSPFIIGGHSGKLGALNVERSILDGYFKGKITDIRLYNRPLDKFEFMALAQNLYYNNWKSLIMYVPTTTFTNIEQIEQFHLNRYAGHKSNKFNIKIKGFDTPESQQKVRAYIYSVIDSIKPANTDLHDIIFI
jgi:hypothetical protein